ncbi:phosphoesterase, MJ0936 family [Schinkia azotoformans MEV2011]|uniref:Phosphoesterase n=1 Tax=Schinkia azotoformans MEV2011 TaxID=1348973 RepID=A0A072P1Z2_SCHAZ|nr:metallophosphoesterase [Schinkia azotoformans]KEF39515.1 phosphoesterase, MJ0936 family [Schinkia azotoformans MEV2011]MEC1694206.1 metallophosphoesterase [Schinkia azotoformans]MEC1723580.1 metallophosphoesterase [Schinkia azotoformans]MEC1778258.1 metallophosphoesterase [Schinkia azotoformans]MED4329458.1 metallophosphoesterase [Schinkia azotoformans]
MKVLIVSDSHGLTKDLIELKKKYRTEVETMIHCGDSELDAHSEAMSSYIAVRGNCDFDSNFANEQLVSIKRNGLAFYVTHGHLYNVKMSLMNLRYRAEEVGANVVCFGHSHIAGAELIDNMLFINPGSIILPRLRKEKTYAILEVDEAKNCVVKFFSIDGKEILELRLECKIG